LRDLFENHSDFQITQGALALLSNLEVNDHEALHQEIADCHETDETCAHALLAEGALRFAILRH
jgi:hypothetical protein